MFRRVLAASLMIAMHSTACAATSQSDIPPATVVVAFDRESITPLIVEGVRNRDSGEPVEANDPVRIASISKLIMTLAVLRLFDEGKVEPDADISSYLGWEVRSPHHPDAEVTLAHLLMHRAGLRDRAGYVIPLGESLEEKLKDPEAWYVDAPPGKTPFEYANLGSSVVATVLEAVTGERYDQILEQTVFEPIGVEACVNWIGCSDDMAGRAVALYRHSGEEARDFPADLPPNCTIPVGEGMECSLDEYVPGTNASVFSPQGGVRIGMVDLARIGQRLLQPRTAEFLSDNAGGWWLGGFMAPQPDDQEFFCVMGTGLQMIPAQERECLDDLFGDGRIRFGHAGEAYGLQSGLWLDWERGQGIAYFRTQGPPPVDGEDTGGFSQGEKDLMMRAQELLAAQKTTDRTNVSQIPD